MIISKFVVILLTLLFVSTSFADFNCSLTEALNKVGKATVYHGIEVIRAFKKANIVNAMYAPYSMIAGIQPFFNGTNGETKEHFFEATRLNDSIDSAEDVDELLEMVSENNMNDNYHGSVLVLMSDKYKPEQSFKDYLRSYKKQQRFKIQTVDFVHRKKNVDEYVRRYVKNQTKGLITDDRRDWLGFGESNKLTVINVAAFDGKFKKKFNKNLTERDIFYNNGVSKSKILFMHNNDIFNYTKIGNTSVIEFEYDRGLSFLVILPDKIDGLSQLLLDFNYKFLVKALKSLKQVKIKVSLPTYETTGQNNIDHFVTSELISKIFAPGSDYSGFSKSPGLLITDILSLSYFKLYEEGTTFGSKFKARTLKDNTIEFKANHPFLFLILCPKTKIIFFIGVADEAD